MVVQGLIMETLPAVGAVATGWLLTRLDGDFTAPLIVLGAVFLLGQINGISSRWIALLAISRIDNHHKSAVATVATGTSTVEIIERQEVQNLLKSAAADPGAWTEKTPGQGALGALYILLRYVGLIASASVVGAWSPWLVPILLLPAFALRGIVIRMWKRHFRIYAGGFEHHRRYRYWGEMPLKRSEAKELRVFGLSEWLVNRHQDELHNHLDPVWENDRAMARAQWRLAALSLLPLAAAFCAIAYTTAAQGSSVGVASAALTAAWGIFSLLASSGEVMNMEGSRHGITDLAELRERLRPAEHDRPRTGGEPSGPPLIRFEDIAFGYSPDAPVMKGLNLDIRPGERLAVVGFNGAGKSTLTKLLAGVYRPTSGRILADGTDIADDPQWRSRLAVVFQDFIKYQLTVAENIALGSPGAPDLDSIRKAVDEAGFGDVVDGLESGLDTPLDRSRTGGVDLSGGQWQQLALARALYAVDRGARILVLDEPTAHLDVRTEKDLFDRLGGHDEHLTTVLISHRLSTVRDADRIVLLADGAVAESGTHDELMALGGTYAHMFNLQAERYKSGFDDRLEEGELR
ncbi:ABC transporter ATP-binding protein [Glycomyces luteolus]|uniref:ABC transporter ATP-binding protein n=1 Tax=Glycomyces luteolus TaxID=2670330 RepID=A0A9X3P8S4_9ACTN|nr:ABC transporter ATP-binding protein [Glycomyces luteolus]MDA1360888.1 ABC transporter ATP-binding protein [Glycomyces luteolus]